MRVEVSNQISGMLKTFGIVLRRHDGLSFEALVAGACERNLGRVNQTIQTLLTVYLGLKQQILRLDRELARYARGSALCRRLMTIPGVGLLSAIAFITAIDDPARFAESSSVGAYLGLTPRRYQSGEVDHNMAPERLGALARSKLGRQGICTDSFKRCTCYILVLIATPRTGADTTDENPAKTNG